MRNTDFIFTDDMSESGDASSSTINPSQKHSDWATQVENAQQEEVDHSTDDTIQSTRGGNRGRQRDWRHNRSTYVDKGVFTINIYPLLLYLILLTHRYTCGFTHYRSHVCR